MYNKTQYIDAVFITCKGKTLSYVHHNIYKDDCLTGFVVI